MQREMSAGARHSRLYSYSPRSSFSERFYSVGKTGNPPLSDKVGVCLHVNLSGTAEKSSSQCEMEVFFYFRRKCCFVLYEL